MTRRELIHQEFEEHFYATWPNYIKYMDNQQLINLNEDRIKEVNASYPETMLILKSWVLEEMARRGI